MNKKTPMSDKNTPADTPKQGGARSASRLGAVQALYQMEINEQTSAFVITEFVDHRLGEVIDEDHYANADKAFFANLVAGVAERGAEIDTYVSGALSDSWTLDRIEPVARGILRAGTFELIARPDVPTSVVINEYVDVAKAFFDDSKPGFINGVLDKLAKQIRK